VHRFQNDPGCPLFLISLKAAGWGSTSRRPSTSSSSTLVEPGVEAQAIDRTHRIGQTRRVFAYRLICQDTVEQRIAELQEKKRKLPTPSSRPGEHAPEPDRDDLEKLLS